MPCRDDYYRVNSEEIDRLRLRIDELTQNLCYLCGQAEYHGITNELFKNNNKRLKDWWEKHRQSDTRRVIKEMKKCSITNSVELAEYFISEALKQHPVSYFHIEWFKQLAEKVIKDREIVEKQKLEQNIKREAILNKLSKEEKMLLGIK